MFVKCNNCDGSGYVQQKQLYNNFWKAKIVCPTCKGKGKVLQDSNGERKQKTF